MLIKRLIVTLLALGATGQTFAQGFFEFGDIPGVGEPSVQIDLDPWLLSFVGEATQPQDPATAELLAGLDGVRVRVYQSLKDAGAVGGFIDTASRALETDGWKRMVYIQDGEQKVRIYVKQQESVLSGMTVMVVDATEAVFLNIAGAISPAQLGKVAAAMGLDDVVGAIGGAAATTP